MLDGTVVVFDELLATGYTLAIGDVACFMVDTIHVAMAQEVLLHSDPTSSTVDKLVQCSSSSLMSF